jgi:endoglucanase
MASLALAATAAAMVATEPRADADTAFGFHLGVNAAGLEFAEGTFPGTLGSNYIAPTASEIGYYAGKNMTIVRLPFAWERLQTTLGGSLDPTYLGYLHTTVSSIRAQGMSVLLDVHNYGCYNQQHICLTANPSSKPILVTSAQFSDLWTKLANEFKGDSGVMFGLMNEPKQWDYSGEELQCAEWVSIANAAIAAIRATGATNWITVPGNFYTGAWSWSSTTDTVGASNATTMTAYNLSSTTGGAKEGARHMLSSALREKKAARSAARP